MRWFSWFNLPYPSDAAVPANAGDGGVTQDAAGDPGYRSDGAVRGIPQLRDPPLTEEIKQRQVALILRYVAARRGL
jgi:hypothetical protein